MNTPAVHISVCVCTFKRPDLLRELLEGLVGQNTRGAFAYSIIVVDNDRLESGRPTVERFQHATPGMVNYFVEAEQSIAKARNTAVGHASGDLVAFIDDDEVPGPDWLHILHTALARFQADGILGPVEPRFVIPPPAWAIKAGLFKRPNGLGRRTGSVLHWSQTGTGNVLLRRAVLGQADGPFRLEFGSGGEDTDFFRRAMARGGLFLWCDEAVVYETVPVERTRLSFQLRRALLRGKVALASPAGRPAGLLKSMGACCFYTISLPVLLLLGRHLFVKYLVKNCDHLGKLLAACRINLVRQKYVTE
jgi:glycosyltransferase involved in cell wall biosynthesis